jgi:hypothetical protein
MCNTDLWCEFVGFPQQSKGCLLFSGDVVPLYRQLSSERSDSILVFLGVPTPRCETTKHFRNFEQISWSKPPHIPEKWRLKIPIKYTYVLLYVLFFHTVLFIYSVGRDSPDGIATCYELDGPRIESQWGWDFTHLSRMTLGPNKPFLHNWYRVTLGGKAAGECLWPPTPSSAEVKERVELFLYSPSGTSLTVLVWNLFIPFQA